LPGAGCEDWFLEGGTGMEGGFLEPFTVDDEACCFSGVEDGYS